MDFKKTLGTCALALIMISVLAACGRGRETTLKEDPDTTPPTPPVLYEPPVTDVEPLPPASIVDDMITTGKRCARRMTDPSQLLNALGAQLKGMPQYAPQQNGLMSSWQDPCAGPLLGGAGKLGGMGQQGIFGQNDLGKFLIMLIRYMMRMNPGFGQGGQYASQYPAWGPGPLYRPELGLPLLGAPMGTGGSFGNPYAYNYYLGN